MLHPVIDQGGSMILICEKCGTTEMHKFNIFYGNCKSAGSSRTEDATTGLSAIKKEIRDQETGKASSQNLHFRGTRAMSKGGSNDFGKEAIDTLLKRMEDDRGKFIVLPLGFADDMDRFLVSNDGLRSRFTRFLHFDDYTEISVRSKFDALFASRNLFDKSLQMQASRLAQESVSDKEKLMTLVSKDIV